MISKTNICVITILACLLGNVRCSDHVQNNGTSSKVHIPGNIIEYLDEK